MLFICVESFPQSRPAHSLLKESVSVSYSNATLADIILDLHKRYKINFSYTEDVASSVPRRSASFHQQPLDRVLYSIFKHTQVRYQVVGNQIVLTRINNITERPAADRPDTIADSSGVIKSASSQRVVSSKLFTEKNGVPDKPGQLSGKRDISAVNKAGYHKIRLKDKTNKNAGKISIQLRRKKEDSLAGSSNNQRDSLIREQVQKSELKKNFSVKAKTSKPPAGSSLGRFSIELNLYGGQSFRALNADSREGKSLLERREDEKAKFSCGTTFTLRYELWKRIINYGGFGILNMGQKGTAGRSGREYVHNYTYLNIPMGMGFKIGDKRSLVIHTAIAPSLLLNREKYIEYHAYGDYRENYNRRPLGRNTPPPAPLHYRRFNLDYIIGLHAGQQYKNWNIIAGITCHRFLLSLFEKSAVLNERNYSLGFHAGMTYTFSVK